MLMKRMSILLGWCFAVTAILSNGTEANRHETEIFFGANYNRRDLHCLHGTPLPRCIKVSETVAPRPAPTGDDGLASPLQCLVHISGFQHPKTAYVLLGLQVRPVGDEYLTTGLRP